MPELKSALLCQQALLMLSKWGTVIGHDKWGVTYWVLDGKVWYSGFHDKAGRWGDYFEFMERVRHGAVPRFVHIGS